MAEIELDSTIVPQVTVSELSQILKRTLEDRFGYVRVRGEISGYRGQHSSGHAYFALKDASARLEFVIWRPVFLRLRVKPEEGMEVIASGRITTFAGKSSYQIIVETLEPAGVGALMTILETRRIKLAAEGLFDLGRKKPLPFLPRIVGIVTSPSGAVVRDILHRLADRFPLHVVLWPVRVQGEGSAEEIAAAIRGIGLPSEFSAFPRPDVLIVARGGGSLEDLWSFNDEGVVRAAADCSIPLISAVGHETDWTLIDHASDVRAPTPTAAAEICVPVRSELISRIAQLEARGRGSVRRLTDKKFASLNSVSRGIPSIRNSCLHLSQRLDSCFDALRSGARSKLSEKAIAVASFGNRLTKHSPFVRLAIALERTNSLEIRLGLDCRGRITAARLRSIQAAIGLHNQIAARSQRRAECLATILKQWRTKRIDANRLPIMIRQDIAQKEVVLRRTIKNAVRQRNIVTMETIRIFDTINYRTILSRGYTLVIDRNGDIITRGQYARDAGTFTVRFADGDIEASVGLMRSARRSRKSVVTTTQKELF